MADSFEFTSYNYTPNEGQSQLAKTIYHAGDNTVFNARGEEIRYDTGDLTAHQIDPSRRIALDDGRFLYRIAGANGGEYIEGPGNLENLYAYNHAQIEEASRQARFDTGMLDDLNYIPNFFTGNLPPNVSGREVRVITNSPLNIRDARGNRIGQARNGATLELTGAYRSATIGNDRYRCYQLKDRRGWIAVAGSSGDFVELLPQATPEPTQEPQRPEPTQSEENLFSQMPIREPEPAVEPEEVAQISETDDGAKNQDVRNNPPEAELASNERSGVSEFTEQPARTVEPARPETPRRARPANPDDAPEVNRRGRVVTRRDRSRNPFRRRRG